MNSAAVWFGPNYTLFFGRTIIIFHTVGLATQVCGNMMFIII